MTKLIILSALLLPLVVTQAAAPADIAAAPIEAVTPVAESQIYKKVGDLELKLFIEKPANWKATDRRPAIVFFFGGGWVAGNPGQFRKQSEYFATRGMVGIRVQYRTIPKGEKGPPTVCVQDAKSALRWVRAQAREWGIDPQRIAAGGGSAGGHLAAFTSMVAGLDDPGDDLNVSPRANALVLFNPVFNNGPGQWGHEMVGDRFREFSPAHNITSNAPPTIIFLGRKDPLISVKTTQNFADEMKQVGVRCETFFYEDQVHGFFNNDPWRTRTLIEADKFLASLGWLSGPSTLPEPRIEAAPPSETLKAPKATKTAVQSRPKAPTAQ